jgi:serine/threonine-protein kinase
MPAKPDASLPSADEDRLAHALVSRGLLTREDVDRCRTSTQAGGGPEALLTRLVKEGLLTAHQGRRAEQELPSLLTQQIPGYHLLQKLGQGSMGTVYKAKQLSMNRLVAVKLLLPRLASNAEYLERFHHEAQVAAKLSHSNIVQAINVGSAGHLHYFVMEYVEGTNIGQELSTGKIYGEKEGLEIILQMARALRHAHRRGLIHRDIKPANIILTKEGVAKLADLGMARETVNPRFSENEQGMTMGTPLYMAPEQVRGLADIDNRIDIYALGATFYHMVTGRPPFNHATVDAVLRAHLKEALIPPDRRNNKLSAGLSEVVNTMLAKDRNQRYANAGDLMMDVEALLAGQAPRLARQQISASALEGLAGGEEADDEDEEDGRARRRGSRQVAPAWLVGVVAALLAVSVVVNVVMLLRG